MPCIPCVKPDLSNDKLVDIEKILCDYAWEWLSRASWWEKCCKNKLYRLEVKWSYLDISHKLKRFKTRKNDELEESYDQQSKLKSSVAQRDLCLFRTEFTNTSENPQKFTFKTERSTKSVASISVQKGWRVGASLNLEVAPPVPGSAILKAAGSDVEPCKITGGLSGSLEVSKTKGETYEETLTWSVDTEINVDQNYRTVASLMVREEQFTADFRLESTIRCLRDVIPVYVYTKKDDEVVKILEIPSDMFAEIFKDKKGFKQDEQNNAHVIKCTSSGTFKACYGSEQVIDIKSEKLSEKEEASGGPSDAAVISLDASKAAARLMTAH